MRIDITFTVAVRDAELDEVLDGLDALAEFAVNFDQIVGDAPAPADDDQPDRLPPRRPWQEMHTRQSDQDAPVERCLAVSPHSPADTEHVCYLPVGHPEMHHTLDGAGYNWPNTACLEPSQGGDLCNLTERHAGRHANGTGLEWDTVIYAWPSPPPEATKLVDPNGGRWQMVGGMVVGLDDDGPWYEWHEFLRRYGVARLAPLTDDDIEINRLYGPPGQRWGDPTVPCPYIAATGVNLTPREFADGVIPRCALGVGHIGPHTLASGAPIVVDTEPAERGVPEAMQIICTCGTPASHQPECPRYVGFFRLAEDSGPSETQVLDWAIHNDHADGVTREDEPF